MNDEQEKEIETTKRSIKKSKEVKYQLEIESLKEELAKSKNDYFKAYADIDNLRKRLLNEKESILKYRASGIATELLPGLDNLARALSGANLEDPFVKGVEMVYQQLIQALKNEGVEEIEALDKPFDHNYHNALMSEKIDKIEPGIVVEVLQKGYKLKDRVLRASLVKVSE